MARPEKDPFERVVAHEQKLTRRYDSLTTRDGMMRLVTRFFASLAVLWALLLTAHWVFFPEPRWLAAGHTLVFALVVGYWAAATTFMSTVLKRQTPDHDL